MITCHKFHFCGLVNKTSIFRLSLNHPSSALSLDVIVGCLLGKYDKFHQHLHQNNKDSCISSSVWKAINVSYINPLLLYLFT